ncbi:hypothetical protein [Treponema sp.]|uniref:sensor histidine kinase n=1 Tax=Treponema sp. TaxID=166 RepID=UPI00298E32A9|nr:hypothetical protein [Treponema sp.]MCR5612080.1 hypothetical protein [Treponema sp.]
MNKKYLGCLFLFSLVLSGLIFAKSFDEKQIPQSFIEKYNISQIVQLEFAHNTGWAFITAKDKNSEAENLYAVNIDSPEKSSLVFKNPVGKSGSFSNLCYSVRNETLYFALHTGAYTHNGIQIFLGEGIYVLKKDDDGNYSSKSLRRFYKMEPWLVEHAYSAYFEKNPVPDYTGFLNWLFTFCDYDVKPCLVYSVKDGQTEKKLLNEKALQYLYENLVLKSLCSEEKDNYRSKLEDFLFCLNKENYPTEQKAVTANHCPLYYTEEIPYTSPHYFLAFNERIFMLENIGSNKGNIWSWDYSKLYLITDSEIDFSISQPAGFNLVRAEAFETPYPYEAKDAPLVILNKKLYIRDAVNHSLFQIKSDMSLREVSIIEETLVNGINSYFDISLISVFAIFSVVLLIVCAILSIRLRNRKGLDFAFDIQQKTREEISLNIHDSVVQDIRAIRLDVERLNVDENSLELKTAVIQKITECIKRMRDICYYLNPAEIATAKLDNSKVDIISVVQTLCMQFSDRTKIPFNMQTEDVSSVMIDYKKAEYVERIALEILSNVEKHSYASEIKLFAKIEKSDSINEDNYLTLIFIDDGIGCDLKSRLSEREMKSHFGIRNMKEYAKLCGGKIEWLSAPKDGMQVKLILNCSAE